MAGWMRATAGWLVCVLALFMTAACAGSLKEPVSLAAHSGDGSGNELISHQSRLVLPKGWKFSRSEEKNQLFQFSSDENEFVGVFLYFALSPNAAANLHAHMESDPEAAADVMEDAVSGAVDSVTLHPTKVNGRPGYVYRGEKGAVRTLGLLLPEGRGINNILIVGKAADVQREEELLLGILGSYELVTDEKTAMRRIPGLITFRNTSGSWSWASDTTKSGFTVANPSGSLVVYVGTSTGMNVSDLREVDAEEPPSVVVGGAEVEGRLLVGTKDGSPVGAFIPSGKDWLFIVIGDADKMQAEEAFDSEEVRALLADSVKFEK